MNNSAGNCYGLYVTICASSANNSVYLKNNVSTSALKTFRRLLFLTQFVENWVGCEIYLFLNILSVLLTISVGYFQFV